MAGKLPLVLISAVLGCLSLPAAWADSSGRSDLERAEAEIPRLPPAAFPELPPALLAALEARGCRIPQIEPYDPAGGRDNVISGQFQRPGQTDWAVLCSIDHAASLLVFWGGTPDQVAVVTRSAIPERFWLQRISGDELGFSWLIRTVSPADIKAAEHAFGPSGAPPVDHDGIESAFLDKASNIYYWHQGKWLFLLGAD